MADPYKKLRRQIERKERREHYRRLLEDQLVDIAYRGYTEEQKQLDQQLRTQLEWLNRQQR